MNREEVEKILTHGEWFYAESFDSKYTGIFKHDELISGGWFSLLKFIKCVVLVGKVGEYYEYDSKSIIRIDIRYIKELRPATKEEVLKYFPNEVFPEPKERFKVPKFFENPDFKPLPSTIFSVTPEEKKLLQRKRPITRNKKQHILR